MHTMNIYKNIVATAVIAVASTAAQAVPVPSNETATTLFAGLNWTFGQDQGGPSARIGVIYTDVNSDDDAKGARVYYDHSLSGGSNNVTLTAFTGDTSKVTEVGGGYDFTTGMFGQVGVIGDYWNLGGTYNFGAETWNGFVGFTSFELEAVTPDIGDP
jgi:hypothetical protein